jgi:hypothetical protein
VAEPLLDNPRTFAEKVAGVLGGRAVARAELTGFLSSDFDPFPNYLFAGGRVAPRERRDRQGSGVQPCGVDPNCPFSFVDYLSFHLQEFVPCGRSTSVCCAVHRCSLRGVE